MKTFVSLTLLLLVSLPLHAHYIWLEQDGSNTAKAYFGEWHKDVYEVSGGRLDNFKVDVIVPDGIVIATTRKHDHVALTLAQSGDIAWIEAMTPRRSRNSDDVTRGVLLARSGRDQARALLPFDLVPQAPGSDAFILLFEGQPVAAANISLYNPRHEEVKYTTDAAGKVTLDTSIPGRYVLETAHIVDKGGEVDGLAYGRTRYGLSLSFVAGK